MDAYGVSVPEPSILNIDKWSYPIILNCQKHVSWTTLSNCILQNSAECDFLNHDLNTRFWYPYAYVIKCGRHKPFFVIKHPIAY